MLPTKIPITHEADYHTDCVGTYGDGEQYMGFAFFLECGQQRPVAVLHRFDRDGNHVASQTWEESDMRSTEAALDTAVGKLPTQRSGDIQIKQFQVKLLNRTFGLMPREDDACLIYAPYDLAFFPPFDGTYDT